MAVFKGSTAAVADDGGGGEGVDEAPWDAEKGCNRVRNVSYGEIMGENQGCFMG